MNAFSTGWCPLNQLEVDHIHKLADDADVCTSLWRLLGKMFMNRIVVTIDDHVVRMTPAFEHMINEEWNPEAMNAMLWLLGYGVVPVIGIYRWGGERASLESFVVPQFARVFNFDVAYIGLVEKIAVRARRGYSVAMSAVNDTLDGIETVGRYLHVPASLALRCRSDMGTRMPRVGDVDEHVHVLTGFGYDPTPDGHLHSVMASLFGSAALYRAMSSEALRAADRANAEVPFVVPSYQAASEVANAMREVQLLEAVNEENQAAVAAGLANAMMRRMRRPAAGGASDDGRECAPLPGCNYQLLAPGDNVLRSGVHYPALPDVLAYKEMFRTAVYEAIFRVPGSMYRSQTRRNTDHEVMEREEEDAVAYWTSLINRFLSTMLRAVYAHARYYSELGVLYSIEFSERIVDMIANQLRTDWESRSFLVESTDYGRAHRGRAESLERTFARVNRRQRRGIQPDPADLISDLVLSEHEDAKRRLLEFYVDLLATLAEPDLTRIFDTVCRQAIPHDLLLHPERIGLRIQITTRRDVTAVISMAPLGFMTPKEVDDYVRAHYGLDSRCESDIAASPYALLTQYIATQSFVDLIKQTPLGAAVADVFTKPPKEPASK